MKISAHKINSWVSRNLKENMHVPEVDTIIITKQLQCTILTNPLLCFPSGQPAQVELN